MARRARGRVIACAALRSCAGHRGDERFVSEPLAEPDRTTSRSNREEPQGVSVKETLSEHRPATVQAEISCRWLERPGG